MLASVAIAQLHDVPVANIRVNFTYNKQHFVEGSDYFKLTYAEWMKQDILISPLFMANRSQGIVLFTKAGNLKLTKSLTDAKAWAVHQTLSDCYLQLEEIKTVLKETGSVYVAPEAVDDDNTLLLAKALKAADIMLNLQWVTICG